MALKIQTSQANKTDANCSGQFRGRTQAGALYKIYFSFCIRQQTGTTIVQRRLPAHAEANTKEEMPLYPFPSQVKGFQAVEMPDKAVCFLHVCA